MTTLQLSETRWTPYSGDASMIGLLRRTKLDRQAQETFVVLPHRSDLATCGPIEVHRGQFDRVKLSVPVILSAVLAAGVDRFSIAHNHPGSDARPSPEDERVLRVLAKAAETVGLELLASYIITPTEWSVTQREGA
jgi:DNA repair protein RadC